MSLNHGVRISEAQTPIVPTKQVDSAIPVVIGTAPLWKTASYRTAGANVPLIAYDAAEAVLKLGDDTNWSSYTLCEFVKCFFTLYGMAPAVFINVFDPYGNADHRNAEANVTQSLVAGALTLTSGTAVDDVLIDNVVVKSSDDVTTYDVDDDYLIDYDDDYHVVITRVADGDIPSATTSLKIYYETAKPSGVDADDIIAGITKVDEVFTSLNKNAGCLVAPKWSMNTTVAAAMLAKAQDIDDSFRCPVIVDVSTDASTGADVYSEVAALKSGNSWADPHMFCCWPLVTKGDDTYYYSSHLAAAIAATDYNNNSVPFASPSNQLLSADGLVTAAGDSICMSRAQANSLNEAGVVTGIQWDGSWRVWGNWTAAFVSDTDPKDSQVCVRRMFDWIGNTIVRTFFSQVDSPLNRRTVERIEHSLNQWLSSLVAQGALLYGKVRLLASDNPVASLMSGSVSFRVDLTPVSAASDIAFTLAIDPDQYSVIWEEVA